MPNKYSLSLILAMVLGATINYTFIGNRSIGTQEGINEIAEIKLLQHNQFDESILMLKKKKLALEKSTTNLELKIDKLQTKFQHLQQTVAIEEYSNEFYDEAINLEEQSSPLKITSQKLENYFNSSTSTNVHAEPLVTQITDLFHNQTNLIDSDLIESACNTDICRVEIQHHNNEAETNFFQTLASTEEFNTIEDLFVYNIPPEDTDDGLAHSIFFLAKKDHQLPFSLQVKENDAELEKMTQLYQ